MADVIRNQLTSDGVLRTWKFPQTSTGLPRIGSVEYSERVIKITPVEKEKLESCEKRRAVADNKIRHGTKAREPGFYR